MKGVKHNNDMARAIAKAAGMKSVECLKRQSVRLARELELDLPMYGKKGL